MRRFYRAEDYHQNYYGGKPEPRVAKASRARRKFRSPVKTAAARPVNQGTTKAAAGQSKPEARGAGSLSNSRAEHEPEPEAEP
jgi:hypothetical protein